MEELRTCIVTNLKECQLTSHDELAAHSLGNTKAVRRHVAHFFIAFIAGAVPAAFAFVATFIIALVQ